jgi:hypothetical protein
MSITYGPTIYPIYVVHVVLLRLVVDLHTTQPLDLATVATSHRIYSHQKKYEA